MLEIADYYEPNILFSYFSLNVNKRDITYFHFNNFGVRNAA